jgi:hypothetical protein
LKSAVSLGSLAVTALTGVAVGLFASSLQLEAAAREAAWLGVLASTAAGLLALLWKGRVATRAPVDTSTIRALFTVQVLVLGVRAVAVLVGALLIKARGEDALVAFVLSFFGVYLLQQFIEVRLLLSARAAARPVSR